MIINACINNQVNPDHIQNQLRTVDLKMSAKAQEIGFNQALLLFADETFTKLNDGMFPIIGKENFAKSFDETQKITQISWEPVKVEVSTSGDLGYTWGNWKFEAGEESVFGNYFSVWKRDKSGEWKLVLDGGNKTPKP